MSRSTRLLIRVFLIAIAAGCFTRAYKFFDAARPYIGEISGNPHPPETAKIIGPKMMVNAETWFIQAYRLWMEYPSRDLDEENCCSGDINCRDNGPACHELSSRK